MKIIKNKFSLSLYPKQVGVKKNISPVLSVQTKQAKVKKEEYYLETFKRSNQDTCLIHKPSVTEGNWVQSGDLLTDCASSMGGELSLGQNLLIAYMPWEGYNFEDAILISERLVIDDLYTSVHIERYELETQQTKLGSEEITRNIPDVSEKELFNLDSFGIIKKGSWVEEGDILVGKITPINKKKISPYQKLLYTILEKQVRPIKDSSLRAPKGIKAKVIDIKYFLKTSNYLRIPLSTASLNRNKINTITDKTDISFGSRLYFASQAGKSKKKETAKGFAGEAKTQQQEVQDTLKNKKKTREKGQNSNNVSLTKFQNKTQELKTVTFAEYKKQAEVPIFIKSLVNKLNKKQTFLNKNLKKKEHQNNYNRKTSLFFNKLNQMFSRRYYYKQIKEKFLFFKDKEKKSIDNSNFLNNQIEQKNNIFCDPNLTHEIGTSVYNVSLAKSGMSKTEKKEKLKNIYLNSPDMQKNDKNLKNSFFLFFKLFRYGLDFSFNYLVNILWSYFFIIKKPITFALKKNKKEKNIDLIYPKSKNLLNLYLKKNIYQKTNGSCFANYFVTVARLMASRNCKASMAPLLASACLFKSEAKVNFLKKNKQEKQDLLTSLEILKNFNSKLNNVLQKKKKNKYNFLLFKQKVLKYKKTNKVFFIYINNLFENKLFFQKPFMFSFDSIASLVYNKKNKYNDNSLKPKISFASQEKSNFLSFTSQKNKKSEIAKQNKLDVTKQKDSNNGALYFRKTIRPVMANKNKQDNFLLPFLRLKNNLNNQQIKIEKLHKKATLLKNIEKIHIYLAEKRKIQVGDKMAGRHGNKGIVSKILPIQDMPFLPDGTSIDMVLNPLGVPSRMNVGQIYECLLGLAGKFLGENYKITCFDEIYGPEASRSFVFNKLYEARVKTGLKWLFDPNSPGKIRIYDGRNGECFDQKITVGQAYILRLVHMVDDKIHMRSTGPYSLVTQQPLRGRSKQGGQRLGEMEVWALEGYGAAFTLLEMLTIKSDDMTGRMTLWSNLILNKDISIGTPESFKVLICELQALCLDIGLFRFNDLNNKNNLNNLREITNLINLP